MPKKKGFTEKKYKEIILEILSRYPFMSTSEICDKLNMGYETCIKYLNQLFKENKIKLREIGNRKFWYM
jgi:predicted transcriptional regulator